MQKNILSDLIITNIISAGTSFSATGAKAKRRTRSAWALSFKFEGETEYTCNGRKFTSDVSEIILLPRGSNYEWVCRRAGHCIIIDFECAAECIDIFSFHISNPEKLLRLFRELEYKMTLRSPMYMQECIRELYDIIISLSKEKSSPYVPSSKAAKLRPALDFIAKNYSRPIKNDDLSEICGLSTVYFRKLFSEVLGISPINYVHKLRINKSKEMLASDFASISGIALSVGYSNIYDFSRVFKKQTGISPREYARSVSSQ